MQVIFSYYFLQILFFSIIYKQNLTKILFCFIFALSNIHFSFYVPSDQLCFIHISEILLVLFSYFS